MAKLKIYYQPEDGTHYEAILLVDDALVMRVYNNTTTDSDCLGHRSAGNSTFEHLQSIEVDAADVVTAFANLILGREEVPKECPKGAYTIYRDGDGDYRFAYPVPNTDIVYTLCMYDNGRMSRDTFGFGSFPWFYRNMTPEEIKNGMDWDAFRKEVGIK